MGVEFSSCSKNGGEKENEDAEKTEIGYDDAGCCIISGRNYY
jgi:hypothetical protein